VAFSANITALQLPVTGQMVSRMALDMLQGECQRAPVHCLLVTLLKLSLCRQALSAEGKHPILQVVKVLMHALRARACHATQALRH
jgi:hypothetical protein